MTGQKSKFRVLDESVGGQCKFGDGSLVNIKVKVLIVLKFKNGEEKTLIDVYYIPSLCSNIIILGKLSEDGNQVVMRGDFFRVQDSQGNLVMKVKKSMNRLYKIIFNNGKNKCLLSSCEKES